MFNTLLGVFFFNYFTFYNYFCCNNLNYMLKCYSYVLNEVDSMINFIICDDNEMILKNIEEIQDLEKKLWISCEIQHDLQKNNLMKKLKNL